MRRILLSFCQAAVLFFFLSSAAWSEDVKFEASVSENRVSLGTAVDLLLTVHGTQDVAPLTVSVDGFDVRYIGPSTQVSVINGEYSTSKAFNYSLLPLKEGKFTIPSLEITVKGQIYRTQPIIIDVVPPGSEATDANKSSDPAASASPTAEAMDLKSRIRLIVLVPRTQCFINEKLPVVVKLYVHDVPLQDITLPEFTKNGFNIGDYAQPRQYEEVMEGVKFQVVEFQTSMSPTRTGKLVLGPAEVGANLIYKSSSRGSSRDPFNRGIFNDDFFQSFFNTYQKRPLTITSKAIELDVDPLPEEGKPAGFSGAVGQFDFLVEANPLEVKVGDPVTLRMTVTGSGGDIKTVKMPEFQPEGFKAYAPQVKEDNGKKILEEVVIPTKTDIKEIPQVSFSYFDPVRKEYSILTKGPFPLKVLPPAPGEEFQAVGFAGQPTNLLKEDFGKDIIFIKDNPGVFDDKESPVRRQLSFLIALLLYINIWGGLFGYYCYRARFMTDQKFAKKMRAPKLARNGLLEAEKALEGNSREKFYDVLYNTLRTYLSDAFELPPGELDGASIIGILRDKGAGDGLLENLSKVQESCDVARFSSVALTASEMKKSLEDVRLLIEAIERQLS
ncbi:MAG: protein BatD [Candidatus Omnitrophica bacterium]|nr:protein BatD [Candidatus Omnitrophota bacterium]